MVRSTNATEGQEGGGGGWVRSVGYSAVGGDVGKVGVSVCSAAGLANPGACYDRGDPAEARSRHHTPHRHAEGKVRGGA